VNVGLGVEAAVEKEPAAISNPLVAAVERPLAALNRIIVVFSSLALVAAALILSYSVTVRALFKSGTYWQDEASVFLIVAAVFLSSASVQARRGHVAIEAIVGLLPPGVNRVRMVLVDFASFFFCAFFAWKSWTLLHEAWVDGQVSGSTWAPPLWIPYSLMTVGMTLLSVQIFLQIAAALLPGQKLPAKRKSGRK
jgi:TRAP-type C4-dicarboxylate transport system permease small subunit